MSGKRERLMKQGYLVELRERLDALETRGRRCIQDVNEYLFVYDGFAKIEMKPAAQAFEDLKKVHTEYLEVQAKVKDLEEELGER